MADIEIKRGYEVLADNNIRFGIRVINTSESAISDVEVILDYSESLFNLESSKVRKLGTIPPAVPRTAKFILKPLGCIHKEGISPGCIGSYGPVKGEREGRGDREGRYQEGGYLLHRINTPFRTDSNLPAFSLKR